MPSFPKPRFTFTYEAAQEIDALREYRDHKPGRKIPDKKDNRLLLATWNIANLGLHKREMIDYQVLAEIVSWFDLIALQEVNDRLEGLRSIQKFLPASFKVLFSDKAGNNERLAYVYDSGKISPLEKVGEIAIPPKDHRYIKLPGMEALFPGFDRNPYLAAFKAGNFTFVLVNVHQYFGGEDPNSVERRSLETYAVARWADLRRKNKHAYTPNIMALGDFNLPKVEKGDPIYRALTARGLRLPEHSTRISSSISADKAYDQIAFFPGSAKKRFTRHSGVFDFDGALFRKLWEARTENQFRSYVRYYISDHRPMWAEFEIEPKTVS
jgi:endonuclease/exonuclease/phosphatase family metal-dependent hydrolase